MEAYDDIINLPHHTSKRHPPMSMIDRAAQFAPFDALPLNLGHADDSSEAYPQTAEDIDE